ncbi:MAG: hypothetical protein AB8E82_07220 [Aureispira sp.]
MLANDILRQKIQNLRSAQRQFLLERLVILDTSEEYLKILGVPEELLATLNPPEVVLEAEAVDAEVVVEAEVVDAEVPEEAKPFELPEEYKEIDIQKKQELVELMLKHPELTELSTLLQMLSEGVQHNAQEIAETAKKNALKKTYKRLYKLARGLQSSVLELAMAQELEADIRDWLTTYDELTISVIKEEIENQADILEATLDTLPAILQKAEAFKTAYNSDKLDVTTVSEADLVAGLQRFNAELAADSGATHLKRLKGAKKAIETYSAAAGFLFANVYDVVQKVNDFNFAKQVMADYPSNVIGTYYRGDKRSPAELNYGGKGFEAFNALSLEEARAMAKAWFGAADTKSPMEYYKEHTQGYMGKCISVGNDIACMGYGCIGTEGADRNVYQIHIKDLKEVPATAATLGEKPHAEQGPTLILNAAKIEEATIIAVKGSERETLFFTGIDSGVRMIYQYPIINKTVQGGWMKSIKYL